LSRINKLLRTFERFVSLPWELNLAGPQRVWFVVYDKTDERRLRARLTEFEIATKQAGHPWLLIDLTSAFAEWMAGQEYRESYFEDPSAVDLLLPEFEASMIERIRNVLSSPMAAEDAVVALSGIACLFGFVKVSSLIQALAPHIRGRLLVFFPGEHENNNYRLLDARDGWNYMAVPITAQD
jgi:hypothetical protein